MQDASVVKRLTRARARVRVRVGAAVPVERRLCPELYVAARLLPPGSCIKHCCKSADLRVSLLYDA